MGDRLATIGMGEKTLNVQMDDFDGQNGSNLTEYLKCKNMRI